MIHVTNTDMDKMKPVAKNLFFAIEHKDRVEEAERRFIDTFQELFGKAPSISPVRYYREEGIVVLLPEDIYKMMA